MKTEWTDEELNDPETLRTELHWAITELLASESPEARPPYCSELAADRSKNARRDIRKLAMRIKP